MVTTKTEYGNIRPTQIEEEMRSSYLDYAMSVIVSRALPDVRDGLKPVQRRILYAMHELGMRPNSAYKKSARLVGEVLGKYHPHNDAAVYDAMVRMAQSWSMRLPLVDGQGNFGSVDGDPPAALRYTEARLAAPAEEMLANLDQDTVDFHDNFDGSLREPSVLPARLPNLLINGASGIAVGMATNIPPHNPAEVCDAIIQLIDHPESTSEQLIRYVKGPDFPTGGIIMGREGIRNAYTTGKGQIIMRARAEVEETKRSRRLKIVVSELPYQVNKATLVEKIAQLAKDKRIEGISEIRDESNRDGMRVVIELRGGVQPMVVLNNLYKLTALQSTFSANMLAIVEGAPRTITLRNALLNYIAFREQVVVRRTEYDLRRARERAHILAGLRIAIGNIDRVIQLIRNAADADAARTGLMNEFGLDEVQARAILDMQLRRIAALERERLETEYRELQESIRGMEELLASPDKIRGEVKKETRKIKKDYGEERRTEISNAGHDISREELEPHEQLVVTFSQGGYIKSILADTYRNQHRGGKGVTSMNTKNDDPVKHILVVDSHDRLLFFTNTGRILSIKAYELRRDTSRNTRGTPIFNVLPISDAEHVNSIIDVAGLDEEHAFLVMATKKGKIKRVRLSEISTIRPSGLVIMRLDSEDELVTARIANDDDDIIMVTGDGYSTRFAIATVRPRGRAAGGVKGMNLQRFSKPRKGSKAKPRRLADAEVVAMDVARDDSKLLVIGKRGFGKLTDMSEYSQKKTPGGKGVRTLATTGKAGPVADAKVIEDGMEIYVVSEQAQVLRTSTSEIRSTGRIAQGVTIFNLREGDSVASVACVSGLTKPEPKKARQETKQARLDLNGTNSDKKAK